MKHCLIVLLLFLLASCSTAPKEPEQPAFTPTARIAPTVVKLGEDLPPAHEQVFAAIDVGDLATVKSYLEGGMVVDSVDEKGITPLMWASAKGQLEIMRYLIDQGAKLDRGRFNDQMTPLFFAVLYQQPEAVRLLVESGAAVDIAIESGITPLHLAADAGYADIASILLEAGADPNYFTTNGLDPLRLALRMEYVPIVEVLLAHDVPVNTLYTGGQPHPNTPLALAAWVGNDDLTRMLLEKGARDPWLSELPAFDPYDFQALDVSLVDGEVMINAGTSPLFIGTVSATRPWVDPSSQPPDPSGIDFFTWTDATVQEELVILNIQDDAGHLSTLGLKLPVFIDNQGLVYAENVTTVLEDGPFVTLRLHTTAGTQGTLIIHQAGETIEQELQSEGLTSLELRQMSTQNQPLTIELYNSAKTLIDTIEIDCHLRSATSGVVFYDLYPTLP